MAERTTIDDLSVTIDVGPDVVIDLRDPPPEVEPRTDERAEARRHGLPLLLALNALNLLDAVLTYVVTTAGTAREANPVVEWMTLPGKVAFVATLSVVLWWLKPRALVIPVAGYALVVAYTIVGALVFS